MDDIQTQVGGHIYIYNKHHAQWVIMLARVRKTDVSFFLNRPAPPGYSNYSWNSW